MRLHTARHVAPFHPTLNRNSMTKSILVTGSSSGFGEMTAYALANAGHQVFASMRDIQGHNQDKAEKTRAFAHEKGRDIRPLELDVLDDDSVERAIVEVVGLPAGKRPLHVTVDPADMGYELVAAMRDRIRADVYRRMGIDSLLNR